MLGEGREELGSIHIPRNETRLVPGAFADPFRVVEVMPGVAPILSGIPYFTVRGAPPGDVGYAIDGVRVPLLFHVGAGPSVIAPGLVDRVDLFPSVYPAAYGRYAGGIMAGQTTAPSTVARGEAQPRIFDAGGMVEQPFADGRGSVLVGGRYGYTGVLLSFVAPDYALSYWDYQARVSYRIAEHDRLSAFAFGAYDFLRNETIGRTLFDVQFHRLNLRWDHETEEGRVRVALTLAKDATLNAEEHAADPGSSTKSRGARARIELESESGRGHAIRAGGDVGLEDFTEDQEVLAANLVPFGAHTDHYGGAWIDVVARPGPGVEVVPAFRFDAFRVREKTVLAPEPRVSTRLRVLDKVASISAFGVSHQVPTFLVPVPGADISAFEATEQESWQASQTIEVALPSRVLARATAFAASVFSPTSRGNRIITVSSSFCAATSPSDSAVFCPIRSRAPTATCRGSRHSPRSIERTCYRSCSVTTLAPGTERGAGSSSSPGDRTASPAPRPIAAAPAAWALLLLRRRCPTWARAGSLPSRGSTCGSKKMEILVGCMVRGHVRMVQRAALARNRHRRVVPARSGLQRSQPSDAPKRRRRSRLLGAVRAVPSSA